MRCPPLEQAPAAKLLFNRLEVMLQRSWIYASGALKLCFYKASTFADEDCIATPSFQNKNNRFPTGYYSQSENTEQPLPFTLHGF
jgi:hypothetical protein